MWSCTVKENTDVFDIPGVQKVGHIPAGTTVTGNAPLASGWVALNFRVGDRPITYARLARLPGYKETTVTPPTPPSGSPIKRVTVEFADGSVYVGTEFTKQ